MDSEKILATSNNGENVEQDLMNMDDMNLIIARAEKQVDVLKKVLAVALKRLNHTDWVDQQGKPYLQASGCEKLMPLFGINLTDTRADKTFSNDDKGQMYIYKYTGKFSWKGGNIEALGACSSRDKFFAWDKNTQEYKPLSGVDETNVMKTAYSNMMVNGITRLIGIRNLTWEELKGLGLDPAKVAKVEYNQKSATPEDTTKQNEIDKWLTEMAYGDKNKAISMLITLTEFTAKDGKKVEGVNTVKKLIGTRLNIAHGNCKKEYENWVNVSKG